MLGSYPRTSGLLLICVLKLIHALFGAETDFFQHLSPVFKGVITGSWCARFQADTRKDHSLRQTQFYALSPAPSPYSCSFCQPSLSFPAACVTPVFCFCPHLWPCLPPSVIPMLSCQPMAVMQELLHWPVGVPPRHPAGLQFGSTGQMLLDNAGTCLLGAGNSMEDRLHCVNSPTPSTSYGTSLSGWPHLSLHGTDARKRS